MMNFSFSCTFSQLKCFSAQNQGLACANCKTDLMNRKIEPAVAFENGQKMTKMVLFDLTPISPKYYTSHKVVVKNAKKTQNRRFLLIDPQIGG